MVTLLEWLAFGGSLFSVWLYGQSRVYGPYAGVVVAILFMVYGIVAGIYAAAVSNIVFFVLHMRNLFKARSESMAFIKTQVKTCTDVLVKTSHEVARESGWWDEFDAIEDDKVREWFIGAKLALVHSEVSEGVEGHRKGINDDHLPQHPMLAVELADAMIRIADLAGALNLDLGAALADKMEYNMTRPDHRRENRAKAGGKSY